MPPLRYEELRPEQFDQALRQFPVCYVPIGSIEWHGEHLPLGTDTFRARLILERASERFGGIVYPPVYSGIPDEVPWDPARYGYNGNVMITEPIFRSLIESIVKRLKQMGFQGLFLLTGHHPRTQPAVLRDIAQRYSDPGCRIWGDTDPALKAIYQGDHAGFGETSFILHGRPELVRIESLKERGSHGVRKDASQTPEAFRATAEDGRAMVESAVDRIEQILLGRGLRPKT